MAAPAHGDASPGDATRVAPPLRRRLACLLYEGVLLFGVVFVAALVYSVATGQRHALAGRHGLAIVAFALVPAVYFVGYWCKTGQTLPMQTWQIRLTTRDGERVRAGRAFARFLAAWVWLLPPWVVFVAFGAGAWSLLLYGTLGWMALYASSSRLHPSRQFWHDLACGTRLVDMRPDRTP